MRHMWTMVAVLFSFALLAGCGHKQAAEAEQGSSAVSSEQEAKIEAELLVPPNAKPGAPVTERLEGAIHPALTERLQKYVEKTGRMPENIYDFANTVVDSMPPAPPGMKYELDPADKTIKVVRK